MEFPRWAAAGFDLELWRKTSLYELEFGLVVWICGFVSLTGLFCDFQSGILNFPDKESSQEARLKVLFQNICQQYVELGIDASNQLTRLTLSTFCSPKNKYDNFPD